MAAAPEFEVELVVWFEVCVGFEFELALLKAAAPEFEVEPFVFVSFTVGTRSRNRPAARYGPRARCRSRRRPLSVCNGRRKHRAHCNASPKLDHLGGPQMYSTEVEGGRKFPPPSRISVKVGTLLLQVSCRGRAVARTSLTGKTNAERAAADTRCRMDVVAGMASVEDVVVVTLSFDDVVPLFTKVWLADALPVDLFPALVLLRTDPFPLDTAKVPETAPEVELDAAEEVNAAAVDAAPAATIRAPNAAAPNSSLFITVSVRECLRGALTPPPTTGELPVAVNLGCSNAWNPPASGDLRAW